MILQDDEGNHYWFLENEDKEVCIIACLDGGGPIPGFPYEGLPSLEVHQENLPVEVKLDLKRMGYL